MFGSNYNICYWKYGSGEVLDRLNLGTPNA